MIFGVLAWSLAGAFALAVSFLTYRAFRTDRPSLNALAFVFFTVFVPTTGFSWPASPGCCGRGRWPSSVQVGLLVLGLMRRTRRALLEMRSGGFRAGLLVRRWWQSLPAGFDG